MPIAPLCIAAHCAIPRRHVVDCAVHDACRGCQPARAADGLRLCLYDTRRIGEDAQRAAQLHTDLADVLVHRRRGGERTSGSAVGAPVPDDDVMDIRAAIHATLADLVARVADTRGISRPWEWYVPGRPEGLVGPLLRRRRVVDDLRSYAQFVAHHAEWLAAQPDADETAGDLRALAWDRRAYALAYPAGSNRLYVGDCPLRVCDVEGVESICGERLYQYPDAPLILCAGCGTEETVEQWQRWICPTATAVVDAYAAAADLALRWCRPVEPSLIRKWASLGKVQPVMEVDPRDLAGQRMRPRRDAKNRTLYVLDELRGYARSIWQAEPDFRRGVAA